jgi:hypothetical protein
MIDDRQQPFDERRPFGIRNRGKLQLHTFQNRKATLDQLRLFPGVIEKLPGSHPIL